MTDIVPVPEGVHSTPFPTNADRTAGTFNPKVVAWGDSTRAQSVRDREIAEAGRTNAVAAQERAAAAEASKTAAATSAVEANTQANRSRDEADRSEAGAASALVAAAAAGAAAGLPSMVGKAGRALVVLPDETGADWAVLNSRGSQDYSASTNINKSLFGTATWVLVELWGGGASGACSVGQSGSTVEFAPGGEGGSYACRLVRVADLAASTNLTIGAGGPAILRTVTAAPVFALSNAGGNSSFGVGLLVAYGGRGGVSAWPTGGVSNSAGGANGGRGGAAGQWSAAADANISLVGGHGGDSLLGGAGGGCSNVWFNGGTSASAGNGGFGVAANTAGQTAPSGVIPSGGGGGMRAQVATGGTGQSGAGARGQARLTWW